MRRHHVASHLTVAALAAACGIAVASLVPEIPQAVRDAVDLVTGSASLAGAENSRGARKRPPESEPGARDDFHARGTLADGQAPTAGLLASGPHRRRPPR